MILDTTALIDLLRGNPEIVKRIQKLEEHHVPLSTTSITVFELWQGSRDIHDVKKRQKIHFLLESLGNFAFDIAAAREAGNFYADLKKEGNVIDPEDCMIAGIAFTHEEKVLTRNIKHFQRIPQITVESY